MEVVKKIPVHRAQKVTLENFNFLKVLGKGSYGKVTLCREKSTNILYAMKVIKNKAIIEYEDADKVRNEHDVLSWSRNRFIISLKYSFQTEHLLCLVMEYASGGNLSFHLAKHRKFDEQTTKFYAAEVTLGLGFLHYHGIIHRDLKPENILFDEEGHIKIADFGFCKQDMECGTTTRSLCGTDPFLAPEMFGGKVYGRTVDWWSVGIILFQMMYGKLPFTGSTFESLRRRVMYKQPMFSDSISMRARDFLKGLLTKNPNKRLGRNCKGAEEVMMHFFFYEIDWDIIFSKTAPPPFEPKLKNDLDTSYFNEFPSESAAPSSTEDDSCTDVSKNDHFFNFGFQDLRYD